MSQIIKTFLGVFLILTMVVTSAGILSSFMEVMAAQNMHAAMVNEIEDSDFYYEVIKDCFDAAQAKGYQLTVTMYGADNSEIRCTDKSQVPQEADVVMARVELKFKSLLVYFGVDSEHSLEGYAR